MEAAPSVELKSTLCQVLEKRGVLDKLRATLRKELYYEVESATKHRDPPPIPPRDTIILNELFRDYCQFNGYSQTLSVFLTETGQPETSVIDREDLSHELGVSERLIPNISPHSAADPAMPVPLVYSLIASYGKVCEMQQKLEPLLRRVENEAKSISEEGAASELG